MHVAVLMPTFDEGNAPATLLEELRALAPGLGGLAVYLVDDGSPRPLELGALPASTDTFDIVFARHPVNLGQGAALETARQLALTDPRHQVFVTMDSDGQHGAADLPKLVAAVRNGADVVFGTRFGSQSNVPRGRRALLWMARMFELALTRLWLSDAHNGYRAFGARAIRLVPIHENRMAHATEIRQRVARHRRELVIVEVPVVVRYTQEALRKGQSSFGAIRILRELLLRYLFGAR